MAQSRDINIYCKVQSISRGEILKLQRLEVTNSVGAFLHHSRLRDGLTLYRQPRTAGCFFF